jgi:hypothetical protein
LCPYTENSVQQTARLPQFAILIRAEDT